MKTCSFKSIENCSVPCITNTQGHTMKRLGKSKRYPKKFSLAHYFRPVAEKFLVCL